jgi:hypothetical protein
MLGGGAVVLDFSALEHMEARRRHRPARDAARARPSSGPARPRLRPSDHYRQIFELTRLNEIGIHATADEALVAEG